MLFAVEDKLLSLRKESRNGALLSAAILLAAAVSWPAAAQLGVDLNADVEANVDAAPLINSTEATISPSAEGKLNAQVNNATDAVVESGAATSNKIGAKSRAGIGTAVKATDKQRMEAAAEAKARARLNARDVSSPAAVGERTDLQKELRAEKNERKAEALAAKAQLQSKSRVKLDQATAQRPEVGTYDAIDGEVETAIEADSELKNPGQRLSNDARTGVQILLPGTAAGASAADKKAARAGATAEAKANAAAGALSSGAAKTRSTISAKTYQSVADVFAKVDKNGDNELSAEERINASSEVQLASLYKQADSDRNGVVTRSELEVAMEANANVNR